MVDQLTIPTDEVTFPDASQLITEDDTPVDNFLSEKQQRLLTGCLYSSIEQPFIAAANVGIYHTVNQPAIVPDVFVSFGVQLPANWWEKQNRCYLVWNFGKPPEIAIEIVSNKVGNELTDKFKRYEHMRVSYYAVYDPGFQLGDTALRLYELRGMHYAEMEEPWLEQVSLGLTVWQGEFEGRQDTWLRWCDVNGSILFTGDERANQAQQRANQAQQRADQEQQRADQEQQRANQEQQRADRLAAYLRSQGIDPDQLPE